MSKIDSSLKDIKDMIGTKRTYQNTNAEIFSKFSSKADLYDYLKNHLQVRILFFQFYIHISII